MLWYPQPVLSNLRKSLRTILLPYLTINAVRLVIDLFLLLYQHSLSAEAVLARLGAIALGLGYAKSSFIPVCMPSWFLYSLFVIRFLVSLCKESSHLVILVLAALGISFTLRNLGVDLIVPIDSALLSLPFFVFGFWFKKKILYEDTNENSFCRSIISAVIILLLVPIVRYNGYVDINLLCTGRNVLLFYGIAFVESLCVINICKVFSMGGGTFYLQFQRVQ